MKIFPHNYNVHSRSGPNKFTTQLFNCMKKNNGTVLVDAQYDADVEFCLIQQAVHKVKPMLLRLDGIWFNSEQDYNRQNSPIKFAYDNADAVVFQSSFNKSLTEHWFGQHDNGHIIHNAPDYELIKNAKSDYFDTRFGKDTEVWSCASSWRPHKRLKENIKYFSEKAPSNAVLIVAGKGVEKEDFAGHSELLDNRIFYMGDLAYNDLLALYKKSSTFIHLAYLDHCPNVVVDAQAAGCKIICSSTGGTSEIVSYGTVIIEDEWDFKPIKLYSPPRMNYSRCIEVKRNSKLNVKSAAKQYYEVMEGINV